MSKKRPAFLSTLLFVIGIGLAFHLDALRHLDLCKLLNAIGIAYALFGAAVLSELVVRNARLRQFIVDKVSGVLMWAHFEVPAGAVAASVPLALFAPDAFPSASTLIYGAMWFLPCSMIPMFIVEDLVYFPKLGLSKDPLVRSRRLGGFLVFAGLVAQLIAATIDLLRS